MNDKPATTAYIDLMSLGSNLSFVNGFFFILLYFSHFFFSLYCLGLCATAAVAVAAVTVCCYYARCIRLVWWTANKWTIIIGGSETSTNLIHNSLKYIYCFQSGFRFFLPFLLSIFFYFAIWFEYYYNVHAECGYHCWFLAWQWFDIPYGYMSAWMYCDLSCDIAVSCAHRWMNGVMYLISVPSFHFLFRVLMRTFVRLGMCVNTSWLVLVIVNNFICREKKNLNLWRLA